MSEKERFVDKGIITIEDQGLTDTLTDKDYWIEDGLEDIVELLNNLHKENEKLKEEKYAYLGEITLYKGEANKRKKENRELKRKHYNELMEEGVKIEKLREENEELKEENNMLKTTIARNESYIQQLTHKGGWKK